MTNKQQRKNRLALADMLENRISDENFEMKSWTNKCGTVGCALGIAVMSGEFGYGWIPPRRGWETTGRPVKNGVIYEWNEIGQDLFGEKSYRVFYNTDPRSRQQVAKELRAIK